MADNVTLNSGSGGAVAAADDIAGVVYQRVKVTLGADGVNDGDVASGNPLPVSVASIPSHAVTNAGTFVVQENGAALTSLQLIDDVVVADDAAFTPATTKVLMAGFECDDTTPDSVNEGDAGAARMSANRNQYVQIRDNAGNERGLNVDANGAIAITVASIPSHAVTEADGANVTLGAKADAKSTATDTTAITIMQVLKQISASVQAPPSQAVTNAGTFAVQPAGSVAHDGVATSVNPNPIGGYASAAAPADVSADGDSVRLWALRNGAQVVQPTFAGVLGVANNGAAGTGVQRVTIASDSTGNIATIGTSVTPGTAAANLGKAEDAAHSSGDVGVMALSVRQNTATALAGSDADYQPLITDTNGRLHVVNSAGIVGSIADDATTPGAPVMIGGSAKETDGTDPGSVSSEDDVTRLITDRNRRLLVNTIHPNLWSYNDANSAAEGPTAIKAAPGAGLSLYITDIVISNGATAGSIQFHEDQGGTPVSKLGPIYMGINGGAVINFALPLRLTANKSFGYTSTTVTTHSITVNGYIAP